MTQKAKHTSGPWDIHGDAKERLEIHQLSDENGEKTIADVDPDGLLSVEERQANAALIAAAPELLDLLKKVDLELRCTISQGGMETTIAESNNLDELVSDIDDFIAKVESRNA